MRSIDFILNVGDQVPEFEKGKYEIRALKHAWGITPLANGGDDGNIRAELERLNYCGVDGIMQEDIEVKGPFENIDAVPRREAVA